MGIEIKYEQLSHEIKDEIERFHKKATANGTVQSIEESMRAWFESSFDQWMTARFAPDEKNSRRHYRIDIELPIKVVDTLIEANEGSDPEFDFVGTILNISRGGLFFRSKKRFELSSIVRVLVDMSSIDPELSQIEAVAMVVRSIEMEDGGYGVGLMFSSIYDEARQTLDLFVFKNLAYFLYK
ncbi:MAG TPA: PilZ domain-containing protein [Spirochaetota bacterium]